MKDTVILFCLPSQSGSSAGYVIIRPYFYPEKWKCDLPRTAWSGQNPPGCLSGAKGMCQARLSIYFTTMNDLIVKLKKDQDAGRTGKRRSYYKSSLVIVDEVGYTPIDREECNL